MLVLEILPYDLLLNVGQKGRIVIFSIIVIIIELRHNQFPMMPLTVDLLLRLPPGPGIPSRLRPMAISSPPLPRTHYEIEPLFELPSLYYSSLLDQL